MALRRAQREGSRSAGFRADRQADSRTGGFLGPVSPGRQWRSLEKKWLAFGRFGLPKLAQADTDQSIALVWTEIHPLPELQSDVRQFFNRVVALAGQLKGYCRWRLKLSPPGPSGKQD